MTVVGGGGGHMPPSLVGGDAAMSILPPLPLLAACEFCISYCTLDNLAFKSVMEWGRAAYNGVNLTKMKMACTHEGDKRAIFVSPPPPVEKRPTALLCIMLAARTLELGGHVTSLEEARK